MLGHLLDASLEVEDDDEAAGADVGPPDYLRAVRGPRVLGDQIAERREEGAVRELAAGGEG